jgi:SHS family sialic acid transporter-like MFS transporter
MGYIAILSSWVGLTGVFVFPALADLYGRRPILILTILGYSLFTGFTGFAQGPLQLLIFTSITRIALRGETPVGAIMVSETAPTKWRTTALGGLVGGYPFGYMLCSLTALAVVPLWGCVRSIGSGSCRRCSFSGFGSASRRALASSMSPQKW